MNKILFVSALGLLSLSAFSAQAAQVCTVTDYQECGCVKTPKYNPSGSVAFFYLTDGEGGACDLNVKTGASSTVPTRPDFPDFPDWNDEDDTPTGCQAGSCGGENPNPPTDPEPEPETGVGNPGNDKEVGNAGETPNDSDGWGSGSFGMSK